MKDLYAVLGVKKSASQAEIKAAYRKLAKIHHPDISQDLKSEDKFKEISTAYEILSDPAKRKNYDNPHTAGAGFSSQNINMDLSDIFSNFGFNFEGFSNRGRQPSKASRGKNIKYKVQIDLETCAAGGSFKVDVDRKVSCTTCKGTGAKEEASIVKCQACNGQGMQVTQQGFMQFTATCTNCQGTGTVIRDHCKSCLGKSMIAKSRSINVKIPPGVESATVLSVKGLGHEPKGGGTPGDLHVHVFVKSDSSLTRKGNEIHSELEVSMIDAVLGSRFSIETVTGDHKNLTVYPGAQPGEKLRIKNAGISGADHVVHIKVSIPRDLTPEQENLLEQFKALENN
jgi:molecular chaperone DnaJ